MISNYIFAQAGTRVTEEKHMHSGTGVMFIGFPLHCEDYSPDVQEIMQETIAGFGEDEWRSVVLTGELHGHLGVYAIIGAKMGLFARELLNAGHDELRIISSAGLIPPVSCLNDGLQVSTGSTLGHGLIAVYKTDTPIPSAEFTYGGKRVKISLKPSHHAEVEENIREALRQSGGLTTEYWQRVRELGLDVWQNYDRQEIFNVEESQTCIDPLIRK